jgi:hypothetical protein
MKYDTEEYEVRSNHPKKKRKKGNTYYYYITLHSVYGVLHATCYM